MFTVSYFFFIACPGGFSNVCSGNGVCDDLLNGTGICTCKVR